MRISENLLGMNTRQSVGKSADIRADQIYNASIKQRISATEAVIEIQGQEYQATFEKGIPQEGQQLPIKITGFNGETLKVRTATQSDLKQTESGNSDDAAAEKLLRESGVKSTPDMRAAVRRLLLGKVPITKETLQNLAGILQKGEGTTQQKLDVFTVMAQKKISITPIAYESVYRVMNGPTLDQILNQLQKEAPDLTPSPADTQHNVSTSGKSAQALPGLTVRSGSQKLLQRLEVVDGAVQSGQPINKKQLQKLIKQVTVDLKNTTADVSLQKKVQQVIQQVESAIQETGDQSAVPADKIKQAVDKEGLQNVLKLLRQQDSPNRGQQIAPQIKTTETNGDLQKLTKLVLDIRTAGNVSRDQLVQLKEAIQQVVGGLGRSSDLNKNMNNVVDRLLKNLQMSANYEAVGRSTEAKAKVLQGMDTLVKLFKLPIVNTDTQHNVSANGKSAQALPGVAVRSGSQKLLQRLEVVDGAVQSGQPINKEQLRKLIKQVTVDLKNASVDISLQKRVQQVIQQVDSAIQEAGDQSAVPADKIKQAVDKDGLQNVLKLLRQQDLSSRSMAYSQQSTADLPDQAEEPAKLIQQLGALSVAMENGQPINSAPQIKTAETSGDLQKLAKLVLDIRTAGKVNRDQLVQLKETIQQVVGSAGVSPELNKNMNNLVDRLLKDLRMSASYEAVGRSTEAKATVQRGMDTLVKLFKLPIVNLMPSGNQLDSGTVDSMAGTLQQEEPPYLRPVSDTLIRLGSLTSLARHEITLALTSGNAVNHQTENGGPVPRDPQKLLKDFAASLRGAANREKLPADVVGSMEKLLQHIEAASENFPPDAENGSGQEKIVVAKQDSKNEYNPNKPADDVLQSMDQLEQLFTQSGERIAALTQVQAASFERITQHITDHLRTVGEEFTQTKKEIQSNVNRMSYFLQQKVPQAATYVERIIEPTIEMVDRLVNKGEFAMFADMEFEHSVLKVSGDLQQVKSLLSQGKVDDALKSFHNIKNNLEKLNWQPSYVKTERFFSKMTGEGTMQNPFHSSGEEWRAGTLSGRGVQEWMRGLGMNHERDALEWMGQHRTADHSSHALTRGSAKGDNSGDPGGGNDSPPQNFKSMLIERLEGTISGHGKDMLEQALSNVTGQQLLSKQDPGNSLQTLYVQLPLPWENGTKTVQVHVNSRATGEQMDWENCNLYFQLDTPKYGETGIGITVVNRDMSVRIQNDNPKIEQSFSPYIPKLKEELQRIGYSVNGVAFHAPGLPDESQKNMPTVDVQEARAQVKRYGGQEGVDYSI